MQRLTTPVGDLPLIESCEGCGGKCCSEMSVPGPYLDLLNHPEWNDPQDHDCRRLHEMPLQALAELQAARQQFQATGTPFRTPCFWLNEQGFCRWYDWRPQVCREFELSSPTCHMWRNSPPVA